MSDLLIPVVRPPAPRYEISAEATLTHDGTNLRVELCDISVEGLKLATDSTLAVGAAVLVRLPDRSRVGATVRWTRDGKAGLRFEADLPEEKVREIARV